ncbi:MAG: hypothetical protein WCL08_00310 [Verrucomicrobiota bacterium]
MSSYSVINAQTLANIVATNNTKEQKWVLNVYLESLGKNPFTKFIGGFKGGKPIIQVADTQKLHGTTITIHRKAGVGGMGQQGETARDGQERKNRFSNWQFSIGRLWQGLAQNTVARDQTVIGSTFDQDSAKQLAEWLGWRQGLDLETEMIVSSHSRNTLYPGDASSRESLRSKHYLQSETVTRATNILATLQAQPLNMAKSAAGADIMKYLLVGSQFSFAQFKQTSTYTNIVSLAGARGETNPLFQGGLPDWNGAYMWEWYIPDHTAYSPVGSAGTPRAILGTAIADATSAVDILGGGSTEGAALTDAGYFQNFSNSAYMGFEGEKRASSTGTTRYVLIQNVSGADAGKFGMYSYTVNNGTKLTMGGRLNSSIAGIANTTLGNVVWDTGIWSGKHTAAHPQGSLVYECNSYGQPFVKSYMMADEAIMCGYGSIDGKVAMGNRTEWRGPHGLDYAVGLESVWGSKAIPRVDGLVNGYAVIESAYSPDGLPNIV